MGRNAWQPELRDRILMYDPMGEPKHAAPGWRAFASHYLRDLVYAANDGLITTFAVVAGARGAGLGAGAVLVLGFANLAADGLSMAIGNYLGIKSERGRDLGEEFDEWPETLHAARHGGVTWIAFVAAGLIPLLPVLAGAPVGTAFWLAVALTGAALFGIGALRTYVTNGQWWLRGLEMLAVGAVAGVAALAAGWGVEALLR